MLDRELLIRKLTERAEAGRPGHDEMFRIRGGLRALSLTNLAARFHQETGKDPYSPERAAA